ncbi:uncharacterized protein LOC109853451 isoform X2 [Pseudomyrmex gracilis]|uniref:uncharacterized protein LOC109853451 isoform X2 n=1 Tax=Pseudomyrmex gracilis TaxID=219809 RepID=UPI000994C838|nr:uncharacterized protein LOC109853451 isoform X2 [Pseudomyrmex gracilis]
MAVDNPSYFSLSGGASSSSSSTTTKTITSPTSVRGHGFSALFRRKACGKMGAAPSQGGVIVPESMSSLQHEGRASTPTEERMPMLSRNGAIHSGKRRSFRNLFRSVSANTDHEKTQKFLQGDPRPSDIAPPSPYLPHRSHSHSEKDRYRPGRGRRVLKSASELLSNDMVYCGLTGNAKDDRDDDDSNDDDDDNEVFEGNDARYYNVSFSLPTAGSSCRRRHSIGTYLGKETGASSNVAVSERQGSRNLEVDAAAPVSVDDICSSSCNEGRQVSGNKARRRKHKTSSNKGSRSLTTLSKDEQAEDDILFVSSKESEASNLWVNYLTACFEQISRQQGRPPFKVCHVTIEEPIGPKMQDKIRSFRLQIVVVCPVLLEHVRANLEHAVQLTKHLIAEKVLAMMLGVHDSHINDTLRSSLVSYDKWKKFFVKDQDETFVGELLGAAVAILGATPPPALKSDKVAFSVHPKKVKLGQNRIIVLLNDPLTPKDNVSVVVDRCGDAIDIKNVKRRNPYALQFSIPERCLEVSMLVGIKISKNGCSLGVRQVKCESRLRELDQILRAHDNPLEFMCQTFGFSSTDREQLDNWMFHAFQKNVPPHFNLLSTPSGMVPAQKNYSSPEEYPTLLHFAARFGLERLAWQLLECPGSELACDLRNVSELTPAEFAEQAGHTKLAHQLRGYMQMNEFTNMYSYLKVMSQTTNRSSDSTNDLSSTVASETGNEKEDYCRPRPLSEAYSVPPAARPVTSLISTFQTTNATSNPLAANYSIVPTPKPVMLPSTPTFGIAPNGLDLSLQGYMRMHPVGVKTPTTTNPPPSRTGTPTQGTRQECHHSNSTGMREDSGQKVCQNLPYSRTSSNSSTKSKEPSSGPQDELLEIINDFKNNVFTISEVERLVENWQKRNDVQQSFKDKQRQLMAMREEYDRIQKKMKEDIKTVTPFDKIRKFFSKGKKDTKESAVADSSGKSENINSGISDRRPVSSLSLRSISSSSSSGRMSTVSGCSGASLGDSGTHSDSEDRRMQNVRDEKTGITSYEIPPAPKPFTGRYSPASGYSPSPSASLARDLDLRQITQSPSRVNDEYYIAFPPSRLPIHLFKADGSLREPNTPISPCEPPRFLDCIQNVTVDVHQKETQATKQTGVDNSYVNIDPSTSNFASLVSPGMCIPDCASTEPTSANREETAKERENNNINDIARSDITVAPMPSLSPPAVDKVDSAGQETVEMKYERENTTADVTVNVITQTAKEVTESETRIPEYVNLAIATDRDTVKVIGAIPKKPPAPPVPPRTTTLHID